MQSGHGFPTKWHLRQPWWSMAKQRFGIARKNWCFRARFHFTQPPTAAQSPQTRLQPRECLWLRGSYLHLDWRNPKPCPQLFYTPTPMRPITVPAKARVARVPSNASDSLHFIQRPYIQPAARIQHSWTPSLPVGSLNKTHPTADKAATPSTTDIHGNAKGLLMQPRKDKW